MTTEKLSQLHRATPFRPFRLYFADGGHADVLHPELMAYAPAGRTAVIYAADDTYQVVDLLLVSRLEVLNGKHRRQGLRRS